jgi:pimeloyl-ACP methyl ester carboxylesterase
VIGHGFSNRIVRCLVADRPDLVRSVVMLGGIGEIAMDPDVVRAMRAWFRADATDAECLDVMRYEVGDPATAPHVLRLVTRCPALAVALIAADRATPREECAPFKSDAPVLVVQGLADRIAPRVDEPTLRGQFGHGARLVNVPQVGHMLCVERPRHVADAVLSFLAQ